jgi:hypothetical protein
MSYGSANHLQFHWTQVLFYLIERSMGQKSDQSLPAVHADLFRKVWPKGIPEHHELFLRSLSQEQLDLIALRIEAVWRANCGERPFTQLAKQAGVSRPRFYLLRQSWARDDIKALLPWGEVPKRSSRTTQLGFVERSAAILRESVSDVRNTDIVAKVLPAITGKQWSEITVSDRQNAERSLVKLRADVQMEEGYLHERFGAAVIVDLVQTNVVLTELHMPSVLGLVLEPASGLILGAAIEPTSNAAKAQLDALHRAAAYIASNDIDMRQQAPKPALWATLAPGIRPFAVLKGLDGVASKYAAFEPGGYGRGPCVVQCIGKRLGKFCLSPRHALTCDPEITLARRGGASLSSKQANAALEYEVNRHNNARLKAVKRALASGSAIEARGAMHDVLAQFTASYADEVAWA